jgi:hypothetical protein
MITPPRLELRPRRQVVGARDRVVDARGQHVVRIRINMRRTQWKSKRMDVNASASHAANISYLALSVTLFVSFFFLCVKGFFCHHGSGCYMYNTSITHKALKESARMREITVVFFVHSLPSFPSFLPSRHDEPNPTHHMYSHIPSHRVSPIGSC